LRLVTIPNAEHFFEQSEKLIAIAGPGAPRQVDLRRAISGAYYGVFHSVLAAAADEFVGRTKRASVEYALAYRSVDHRWLREVCFEIRKPTLPARYKSYEPLGGFSADIKAFAAMVADLQESRHDADYNPRIHLKRSDVVIDINTARSASDVLNRLNADHKFRFLALLLFPPR
jgi:uncharacterized protein (UPF0332 family)